MGPYERLMGLAVTLKGWLVYTLLWESMGEKREGAGTKIC